MSVASMEAGKLIPSIVFSREPSCFAATSAIAAIMSAPFSLFAVPSSFPRDQRMTLG